MTIRRWDLLGGMCLWRTCLQCLPSLLFSLPDTSSPPCLPTVDGLWTSPSPLTRVRLVCTHRRALAAHWAFQPESRQKCQDPGHKGTGQTVHCPSLPPFPQHTRRQLSTPPVHTLLAPQQRMCSVLPRAPFSSVDFTEITYKRDGHCSSLRSVGLVWETHPPGTWRITGGMVSTMFFHSERASWRVM